MKLEGFDIFVIDVPWRADGRDTSLPGSRSILIRVRDETGLYGWGESPVSAGASPAMLDQARDALREAILPAFAAREFGSFDAVADAAGALLEELPASAYPAFCGAELALLDLMGHRLRRSSGDVLGRPRQPVIHYGGLLAGDDAAVTRQAAALRRTGIRDAKLIAAGDLATNLSLLDITRELLGEAVEIRVAPGGCWDAEEALDQLAAMAPFRLAGVEQPVPVADVDGLAAVTAAGIVPVIATGAVVTAEDAKNLAARKACDMFSISISRCGGLINAARIHRIARDAGLGCQLGADAAEAGLLAAAGRLFATRAEGVRWCEIAPGLPRLADSITEPPLVPDLAEPARALRGYGLGVRILESKMEQYVSQRISVS